MELWKLLNEVKKLEGRNDLRIEKLKELKRVVKVMNKASPFIGRILLQEKANGFAFKIKKIYAGEVKKLSLNIKKEEFEFTICDNVVHQKKIPLEELNDIQVFYDEEGKPIWISDLLKNLVNDKGEENG